MIIIVHTIITTICISDITITTIISTSITTTLIIEHEMLRRDQRVVGRLGEIIIRRQ